VVEPVPAPSDGYVAAINAEAVGVAVMRMGAGRAAKEDAVDAAVGLVLRKKVGDPVIRGEPLAELHLRAGSQAADAAARVTAAYAIAAAAAPPPVLVHEVIG
jgi:pyrimidine-nucleoside phosphorylase